MDVSIHNRALFLISPAIWLLLLLIRRLFAGNRCIHMLLRSTHFSIDGLMFWLILETLQWSIILFKTFKRSIVSSIQTISIFAHLPGILSIHRTFCMISRMNLASRFRPVHSANLTVAQTILNKLHSLKQFIFRSINILCLHIDLGSFFLQKIVHFRLAFWSRSFLTLNFLLCNHSLDLR